MHRAWTLLVAPLILCGAPGPARADNWLQAGHDARYTYASKDTVKLPLTDIWTVPAAHPCSVAYGRAYYVVTERAGGFSTLVCASARTGLTLWRQPLWCNVENSFWNHDLSAPCVSEDGVVFVTDAGIGPRGHVPGIHAYNALTGQSLGGYVPPPQLPDPPSELIAYDGQVPLAEKPNNRLLVLGGEKLPAPRLLLDGGSLFTYLGPFLSCSWTPQVPPRYGVLLHLEQQLDLGKKETHTVDRVGIPYQSFVSAGKGTIVSGYWMSNATPTEFEPDFIAKTEGPYLIWHRDFPWRVINPCVDNGAVFALLSGNLGTQAVTALDAQTGATRWLWPRPPGALARGYTMLGADPHAVPDPHRIVLADGKVFTYGEALGLVALDQQSGHPLWNVKPGGVPLAASRDHLFVQTQGAAQGLGEPVEKLVALRLTDGKPEWVQEIPVWTGMGRVRWCAVADGQLYARSIARLTTFAPAERLFRLAVDTEDEARYRSDPDPAGGAVAEAPEKIAKDKIVADAAVLRLPWNEPLAESNRKLTARRKAAGKLPLLLELEWLDSQRAAVLGAPTGKPAQLPERKAFVARCRALAAEYQPEHLDLAPEVNLYLTRYPEQADAVRALLQAAVQEVRAVSPKTLTLASLNAELLHGLYGRGPLAPFGKLDLPPQPDLAVLKSLLAVVDEAGFSSCPQAAFLDSIAVPRDYFLALKQALASKQVVVTDLHVEARQSTPEGLREQAAFLKHLLQNCYWLEAALVACPDLLKEPPPLAPVDSKTARAGTQAEGSAGALQIWQDALRWERVEHLTLALDARAALPAAGPQ